MRRGSTQKTRDVYTTSYFMSNDSCRTIEQSLQEYGRGIAGGLIFSLPLLFTMEMWWAGFISHPSRLLFGLLGTFLLLLGYNRFAGLRSDSSFWEVVIDSVEELGLGLVISASMLFLLGRIHSEMPFDAIMGQIVVEALTVAIGVSVGTAQLGTGDDGDSGMDNDDDSFIGQTVLAFCGAVLFAANVAPTEEIVVLAVENEPLRLLALVLLSLTLSALILNFSAFHGTDRFTTPAPQRTWFSVLYTTVVSYAIALSAAAAVLWFFGRFDDNSAPINLAQCIVLGLPAALGASAGRLLVQGNQS